MTDTHEKLSPLSVGLHWIIALGMIAMIAFGLYLEDLPRSPAKSELIGLHKSLGVVLLALAAWRILRRLRIGMPRPLSVLSAAQARLAAVVHGLLLLATLLLPVSGMLLSIGNGYPVNVFGLPFIPKLLAQKNETLAAIGHVSHGVLGKVVIVLVIVHVAASLKHALVDRDGTMKRMLGQRVRPLSAG